jgi:hypothetical protein
MCKKPGDAFTVYVPGKGTRKEKKVRTQFGLTMWWGLGIWRAG